MKCFAGSGCQFKDIVSELQRLGHMGTDRLDRARRTLAPYIRSVSTEHVPDARAAWLWNASVPLHGTPAQTYLERRGILIAPPSLRYCAGSRAMIAGFQRPDGKLVAVQATFLTIEGEKVTGRPARLTYGSMRGGAVRLAAGAEVMGLAEGTETGLSAMAMSGVPVWVALGGAECTMWRCLLCPRGSHLRRQRHDRPRGCAPHRRCSPAAQPPCRAPFST